jgi:glycosyltransferase involved in cell wall biosynthesis
MQSHPITYLCKTPHHGDAHWRIVRPYVRLKEAGVDARICWLGPDDMPTMPVAGRVVVVQRVIVSGDVDAARAWVDRLHAAGALAVVMELDDDELTGSNIDHLAATHPLSTADRAELERQRRGLVAMTAVCDGVTVSVEPLAEVARRYTDRPVIVCPNAIDVDWFKERLAPQSIDPEHLTIGWAGWRRPDADLEPMAEAWARIAARYPDVRFVVAGHQPDIIYAQDIPLDRIIRRPIAPLDEYPQLHQVDIGCCAVADSPFSRCKSPIKAWEYALVLTLTLSRHRLMHG